MNMTPEQKNFDKAVKGGLNPGLAMNDVLKGYGHSITVDSEKEQDEQKETATLENEGPEQKDSATPQSTSPDENGSEKVQKSEDEVYKKRYDDLKRHHDSSVNELRGEIASLKDDLKAKNTKLPSTEQELKEFKESNPSVYNLMMTLAIKEGNSAVKDLKEEIKELKTQKIEEKQSEAFKELLKLHPDAQEIKNDPKFADWFNLQTKAMQNLIENGSVQEVSFAIDKYKKETGLVAEESPKKDKVTKDAEIVDVKGATPPKEKTEKIWNESDVAKMSSQEYARYEEEIDKARKEGRFNYNLSNSR